MKTEHFMVSTLDFFRVFFVKNFFPKFELLNSGCGLSASAAYLRVFTVHLLALKLFVSKRNLKHNNEFKILQFKLLVTSHGHMLTGGKIH